MRTSHGTDNLCNIRASVVSDGVCGDDTTSSIRDDSMGFEALTNFRFDGCEFRFIFVPTG
jgi:hypothetical protein